MISVIVPVYNVEMYIDKCVQSIVDQTYKNLEIILIDDGSTDKSGIKCDLWEKRDNRIVVIHKKNGGLSSARNAGIEIAKGRYLAFVDSDDYIEPQMYKDMLNAAEKNKTDIVCCGVKMHLVDGRVKLKYASEQSVFYSKEEAIVEVLLEEKLGVAAWNKIYKREVFNDIFYPINETNEDAAIILQLLDRANSVINIGKPYYNYIFRDNSISKKKYSHERYVVVKHCKEIEKFIKEFYPQYLVFSRIYSAKNSLAVLEGFYTEPNSMKKYNDDYTEFRRLFDVNFLVLLKEKRINNKTRIIAVFVKLKIYPLYVFLKKFYRKLKLK